jgi:NADH dehydrogenase FAD-containing subunit
VRDLSNTYYAANCTSIDLASKKILCQEALSSHNYKDFTLAYDKLVIAVGAVSNTFNTPGVHEHALFLRDISDARKIRKSILEKFEFASEPFTTEAEQLDALHFAVVGAGPTGDFLF